MQSQIVMSTFQVWILLIPHVIIMILKRLHWTIPHEIQYIELWGLFYIAFFLQCLLYCSTLYIYKKGATSVYCISVAQVGFSNLVKREKDQTRRIWVAEATVSSTYTLSHEISKKSHFKEAAICAEKWASSSYHVSFFTLDRSPLLWHVLMVLL